MSKGRAAKAPVPLGSPKGPIGYLILSCLLLTVSTATARNLKVATVDTQVLFKQYPGTTKAQEEFDDFAREKKQDLADSEEILKELQEELKDPKSALSPKERRLKEDEFARETKDYQDQKNMIQAELDLRNQEMTKGIMEKIKVIVTKLAKQKGFDLVLDSNEAFYSSLSEDLTPDVLRAFSKLKMDDMDTGSP